MTDEADPDKAVQMLLDKVGELNGVVSGFSVESLSVR